MGTFFAIFVFTALTIAILALVFNELGKPMTSFRDGLGLCFIGMVAVVFHCAVLFSLDVSVSPVALVGAIVLSAVVVLCVFITFFNKE